MARKKNLVQKNYGQKKKNLGLKNMGAVRIWECGLVVWTMWSLFTKSLPPTKHRNLPQVFGGWWWLTLILVFTFGLKPQLKFRPRWAKCLNYPLEPSEDWIKSTQGPVGLTIESILDEDNYHQDKCCMRKCLRYSCPRVFFESLCVISYL